MNVSLILESADELYDQITDALTEQETRTFNEGSWSLKKLDDWKMKELPKILFDRYENGDCFLNAEEIVRLMDWKVTKGKFRAPLRKYIRDNPSKLVEEVTRSGINSFLEKIEKVGNCKSSREQDDYYKLVKESMKEICKLKGVGPAFSSLVLSELGLITRLAPPFFSDEAFMYYARDSDIKYNVKEYMEEYLPVFVEGVKDGVRMVDLERGGWCLKMVELYGDGKLSGVETKHSDINVKEDKEVKETKEADTHTDTKDTDSDTKRKFKRRKITN